MKPSQAKTVAAIAAIIASLVIFVVGMTVAAMLSGPLPSTEGNLRNIVALAVAAIGGVAAYRWLSKRLSN